MKIPKTDSIEELAAFWSAHSVTEFESELEEVTQPVFVRQQGTVVPVALSEEERSAVHRIAAARGVEDSALIREWVKEKLHP
jgi:hypothetical protein